MKKLPTLILGILIGALATYYFCPRMDKDKDDYDAVVIRKPSGVITPADAQNLNDHWTNERQAANDSAAKKYGRNKDNRWAWWSLDDMRDYLNYAESQSDTLGYTMSGVRVYLGVYAPNAGQAKKNLTTMFMVPTGKKKRNEASMLSLSLPPSDDDVPNGPPLNDGGGGENSYPQ